MEQEKKYILDTTKAIENWNSLNRDKRQKNQSILAKELGISNQSLVYWKNGGEKTPKWIGRALKLTQIVPSKFADIVKTQNGVTFIDYDKIKKAYNTKYPQSEKDFTNKVIFEMTGLNEHSKVSAKWVSYLYKICNVLDCEPCDIIFELNN